MVQFVDGYIHKYIACWYVSCQQIDGEAFLLLTQTDIVRVLKIKLGPAIKIYNSILMIRNNVDV